MKRITLCLIFFAVPVLFADPRIVSLTPAITETICFLGGDSMLAGRSSACDYPASIKRLPAAGDYTGFYLEKLLKLKPDYVISNDFTVKANRQKRFLSF